MNKLKKKTIILPILFFILCILIFGISYAYFNGSVIGIETDTTIASDSGIMQMHYDGGAAIAVTSFVPSATAFATKNFTVTGNNNTNEVMYYNISLVMESNTFSYDALKYKLTSTNTGGNGTIAPSITTMKEIGNGAREIFLGNGSFTGPTDNKVHTYKLELFFPVTGGDQSHDQSKSFSAHIEIEEGEVATNPYLNDYLISQYGGSPSITAAPAGTFDYINGSTENVMYKMEDDYGMSYYLRGAKDYVNNNIIFAEHQWKIVRINGDGSIRIIYNGTCPNDTCTINTTGTTTQIGTSTFNTNNNDNKYVGYMYGGAAGSASTSREQATTNETSSTIKTAIDAWYLNNIYNTEYEDYISDTLFCNDRQLQSEVGGLATGTGFGTSTTYYAAYYRLYTKKIPNIKCGLQNDRFTASDITIGNGALTYPIGLLTPDETAIAGLKSGISNSTNYLYTNQYWWTSGPSYWSFGNAFAWSVLSGGHLGNGYYVDTSYGVRGALNLNSETQATGTGTTSDPFKVV